MTINEEELQEVCDIWAKRLGLTDWKIKVKLCRFFDMAPNRDAEIGMHLESRQAHIAVIVGADRAPGCWEPYDPELSIVHELLHIHFKPLSLYHKHMYRIAEEQSVCAISEALVEGRRFRPDWVETPQETVL